MLIHFNFWFLMVWNMFWNRNKQYYFKIKKLNSFWFFPNFIYQFGFFYSDFWRLSDIWKTVLSLLLADSHPNHLEVVVLRLLSHVVDLFLSMSKTHIFCVNGYRLAPNSFSLSGHVSQVCPNPLTFTMSWTFNEKLSSAIFILFILSLYWMSSVNSKRATSCL